MTDPKQPPALSEYEGARFDCGLCALGRDCAEHDAPAEVIAQLAHDYHREQQTKPSGDLLERAREVLSGINDIYGAAGTFTAEQSDDYAIGHIATAMQQAVDEAVRTIRANAVAVVGGACWAWLGDGNDDLASMSDAMVVRITAGQLRGLVDEAVRVERERGIREKICVFDGRCPYCNGPRGGTLESRMENPFCGDQACYDARVQECLDNERAHRAKESDVRAEVEATQRRVDEKTRPSVACAICHGASGLPLCGRCDVCRNCHPGSLHAWIAKESEGSDEQA